MAEGSRCSALSVVWGGTLFFKSSAGDPGAQPGSHCYKARSALSLPLARCGVWGELTGRGPQPLSKSHSHEAPRHRGAERRARGLAPERLAPGVPRTSPFPLSCFSGEGPGEPVPPERGAGVLTWKYTIQ